ncbi:MAG: terminase [Chloroflexi bacterium]|nr:terminase [Chloroflexota bacterium]
MAKPDILQAMPSLGDQETWEEWFEGLSSIEKADISELVKGLPKVGPMEGPQQRAYNSEADVLGYGGAAGGGKSALLALLALHEHTRTVIFRDDATQLSGLIDDVVQFFGTTHGLNRQNKYFYFGDRPGHMMEWGGLGNPGDETKWQGRAHDFLAADEVTNIPRRKLMWLMTWLRSPIRGQRCRAVFTFNPPGNVDEATGKVPLGRWVISFFAPWIDERHPNPAQPGELRFFHTNDEGLSEETTKDDVREIKFPNGDTRMIPPRSRTFIPATALDNTYQSAEYIQNLYSLEEPFRSQMLYGSFKQVISDHPKQAIPSKWVDEAMERWTPDGARNRTMSAVGLDVARGGIRSFTCAAPRYGLWFDKIQRRKGSETPTGRDAASFAMSVALNRARIVVDMNGVGVGAYESLEGAGINPLGIFPGARSSGMHPLPGRPKLYNWRAWGYWLLRMLLNPERHMNVCLPPDDRLRDDLCTPLYDDDVHGGKILIESKDDLRKRLGRSTDDGDAVILSLAEFMVEQDARRLWHRPNTNRIVRPRASKFSSNEWMSA